MSVLIKSLALEILALTIVQDIRFVLPVTGDQRCLQPADDVTLLTDDVTLFIDDGSLSGNFQILCLELLLRKVMADLDF